MHDICMFWHSKSGDVNDICVLRHSKIGMSNIIGYFFSLSNKLMYDILERKICKEKSEAKRSKMLWNMIASVYSRRCGSYRMYLEGDSPHQAVMIVCVLKCLSHISNRHNMYTLMQSYNVFFFFSHTTCNILCYSWYMCRYNVSWPSQVLHVLMYAH